MKETMTSTQALPHISSQEKTNGYTRDLRYILTQKCNYHCTFCHKEGCDGTEKTLLNANDYAFVFATAKDHLGIHKATLSGGEPLIRADIHSITKKLHDLGSETTIVTNGALFHKKSEIAEYIDHINLSLHTTNQQHYRKLTGSKTNIEKLIESLKKIHEAYPHLTIKLNSALVKGEESTHTQDFQKKIALAQKYGRKIKYLELCDPQDPLFAEISGFENNLLGEGFAQAKSAHRQHKYTKDGVEIITGKVFCSEAKTKKDPQGYCKTHNDIYITPDGFLSTCPVDIKKISGLTAILQRNVKQLKELLYETISPSTTYQCPFISSPASSC